MAKVHKAYKAYYQEQKAATNWLLEYLTDPERWGESLPVIRETLESAGAPERILKQLDKMIEEDQ